MKVRLLGTFYLLLIASFSFSQKGFYVKGDNGGFRISSYSSLFVDGDFVVFQAGALPINKLVNGNITLTGDLLTYDTLYFEKADSLLGTVPATLRFVGTNDSRISGTMPASLYQLIINKTAGEVKVEENTKILDTVFFESGNVFIEEDKLVEFDYRPGTSSVFSNPFIINETAAHRFIGPGKIYTQFPIQTTEEMNVANTGFYFLGHNSDTLEMWRGHEKQIYAGNGSIDRYFDIHFMSDSPIQPDTISLKYINDVDYLAIGVDTTKLGMYLSPLHQDMDFRRVNAPHFLSEDSCSMTEFSQLSLSIVNISAAFYRVTLADTDCVLLPISSLPDSTLHLCLGDSAFVRALEGTNNTFPIQCYWTDGYVGPNRYLEPTAANQEFVVQLIDSRGCFIFDTVSVAPTAPFPTTNFTWDDACLGDTAHFYNSTTISSGSFSSIWSFEDGSTYSVMDSVFSKLFPSSGSFSFTLTTTSNYGCTKDSTSSVDIFNLPQANIQTYFNCLYNVLELSDSGSIGTTFPTSSAITAQQWWVNGNTASTLHQFNYSPTSTGNHIIELAVYSGQGCKDTVTTTVLITPQDTAIFTLNNACIGEDIGIQNNSQIHNANASYEWIFSDGTTSTSVQPSKSFSTSGLKTVQLVVHSDGTCSDTLSLPVLIYGNPNSLPSISQNSSMVATVCQNTEVNFVPLSIVAGSYYTWDFGDLTTSNSLGENHIYQNSGTFVVSLNVTDIHGCQSSSTSSLTVLPAPISAFNSSTVCFGQTTGFYSNSSGNGLSYQWNFGDLNTANGINPTHVYTNSGNFLAELVVTDANNCQDTAQNTVVVNALPVLNLGNPSTCGNSLLLDANNPGSTYHWSPSNSVGQTYLVNQTGQYTVAVTNAQGCINSATTTVTLHSVVTPNLGYDTSVCGSILLDAGYPGSTYLWQNMSTNSNLLATAAGMYSVTVTDMNGCVGSDTIEIVEVFPNASPVLGPDLNVCSNDLPVILNPGVFASYLWDTGETSATKTIVQTGNYAVSVINSFGCIGSDTVHISVHPSPISMLGLDKNACDEEVLIASSNPNYTFLWDNGSIAATRTVTQTGDYHVEIFDPNTNCSTYDSIHVEITPTPVVYLGVDVVVCSNLPVQLNAAFPNASYTWFSNAGAVLSTDSIYQPTSTGLYLVEVENNGCFGSDAIQVTLLPAPVIPSHPPVFYICGTTGVPLLGSVFGENSWEGPNGLISSDDNLLTAELGTYILTSQVASCELKDTFQLAFSPNQIQANYLVDTDTTKNLALQFIDLTEPTPISYLWDFGDGTYDTIPNPIHTYSFVDTFVTSLTVSNGTCVSTYQKLVTQKNFIPEPPAPIYQLEMTSLVLYPNPNNGLADLEITLNDEADVEIYLLDATGKLLQTTSFQNEKYILQHYDLTGLANGMYFLKLKATSLKGSIQKHAKMIKTY